MTCAWQAGRQGFSVIARSSPLFGADAFLLYTTERGAHSYTLIYFTWCGVAQLVARRLALRQARVRFSARHHREVFPTELTNDEEMERDG